MTVSRPAIEWIGTGGNNVWPGRGLPKKAIVAHIMEGSLAGCISWFANPAAQASSNYGVGKDGRIVCFVDPQGADAPFANGLVNGPDATVQALLASVNNTNLNFVTVSIEHEGHSGDIMPAAQRAASAHLAAWLCQTFSIPADEDHLIGHYEVDSVTRAGCPGWDRAGWLAWEAAILAQLNPPQPKPDQRIAAALAKLDALKTATLIDVLTDIDAIEAILRAPAGAEPDEQFATAQAGADA